MKYCWILVGALVFAGCGSKNDDTNEMQEEQAGGDMPSGSDSDPYDQELLNEFRGALPTAERLQAKVGDADPSALTAAGDARLAWLTIVGAAAINVPVVAVVLVLRTIAAFPPSYYDESENTFLWGPFEDDAGVGQTALYIRKNPDGDDFEYSYAFLRLVDDDIESATPVIWGGANPGDLDDGEDALGVTLWDIEANNDFRQKEDPEYDPEVSPERGRFAMAYGYGSEDDGDFLFNVAVFRGFRGENANPDDELVDADYFFGHFESNDDTVLDFVDFVAEADLCDDSEDACFDNDMKEDEAEQLSISSAFLNQGIGRAQADVSGGDLPVSLQVVECWDEMLDQSFVSIATNDSVIAEDGECSEPFDKTLAEIGVPTLADVDEQLLDALDCVATNGAEACENE